MAIVEVPQEGKWGEIATTLNDNFDEVATTVRVDNTKSAVLQAFYTGNTMSGFSDGDFQRVNLSTGIAINPVISSFTASQPNRDINDAIDSVNNRILYNPSPLTALTIRLIYDFTNKEINKDYVIVWRLKYPDGSVPFFQENVSVQTKKKDASEADIPLVIHTVSSVDNVLHGLELWVAIQKKDETDAGDTTTTSITLTSLTLYNDATAV